MGSTITSAGAASGIDFESIITASVKAKKAQYASRYTTKKEDAQIELTGVGNLKSNLSTFKDMLDKMTSENAFNKRSVTIKQSTDDPVFTCSTKDDASNGSYNVTVTQLASTTSYSTAVADSTAALGAGSLTFSIGEGDDAKTFTVEVDEEDTLESLRKKINSSAENFGVSANIMTLADGTSRFMLDSGQTGDKFSNFSVTATGSDKLNAFTAGHTKDADGNVQKTGAMDVVHVGQDAKIDVDGVTLTSDTNVFDDKIKGLSITVNRLSDTETITNSDGTTSTGYKSNSLTVSTDTGALKSMVEDFLNTYNSLRTNLDNLSKRNTYTDGASNDDGGYLAGDSTCDVIKQMMSGLISSFTTGNPEMGSIFEMGVKMDNDGNLSLDSTKFENALKNNYEQVVAAFSGDDGLCKQLSNGLNSYTKSGGILALREDSLNSTIKDYTNKEDAAATYLEKYEESLRAKYGSLDSMIASMNTSLSYLTSAMSSTSSSKS